MRRTGRLGVSEILVRGSELQFTLNEVKGSDIQIEQNLGFSP